MQKPRGRPRKGCVWNERHGWVRVKPDGGTVLPFSVSAAPRYAAPTGSKPTEAANVQEEEAIELDEPPIVDLAAQKAKEELAYQEWRDSAPMRNARHLQQTMKCPVYYLANDGMMYKAHESPRKRPSGVPS